MYVRPAHFDLPKVDLLTKSTANQAVERLAQGNKAEKAKLVWVQLTIKIHTRTVDSSILHTYRYHASSLTSEFEHFLLAVHKLLLNGCKQR
jgi:hypothetical protein